MYTHVSYDEKNLLLSNFVSKILLEHPYNNSDMSLSNGSMRTKYFVSNWIYGFLKQSNISSKKHLLSKHESFQMKDGGTVCITHYFSMGNYHHPSFQSGPWAVPTIFILNTFSGGGINFFDSLIVFLVRTLGWNVVLFHRRGVHCCLTSAAKHIIGNDDDVEAVLTILHHRFPNNPFFCIGYSAGGCILMRCLGKFATKFSSFVLGACCISSAVHTDMLLNINNFLEKLLLVPIQKSLGQYYSKHGCNFDDQTRRIYDTLLNRKKKKNVSCSSSSSLPCTATKQSTSIIKEFSEVESELYSKSREDFYFQHSVENWIKFIKAPLLCINAEDDVICSNPHFYKSTLSQAVNSLYVITKYGGHCTFNNISPFSNYLAELNWANFITICFFQYLLTCVTCGTHVTYVNK